MEKFKKIAVALVYPEGTVDKCMISDKKYHIEYLKELLNFNENLTNAEIDWELMNKGFVVLYNINLDIESETPSLFVELPGQIGSDSQLDFIEELHKTYPHNRLHYRKLIKLPVIKKQMEKLLVKANKINRYDMTCELEADDIEKYINEQRQILESNKNNLKRK